MSNQALKVSDDWNEIMEALEEMHSEGCDLSIWEADGEKVIEKGASWNLDSKSGQIDFYHPGKNFNHLSQKKTTIYFKGKDKSVLFHQDNVLPLGEHILIDIPGKVNLLDKRAEERKNFGFSSDHFATISFTKGGKDLDFVFSLFDLSPNGMALNISYEEDQLFEIGDQIHIHRVGQSNLMIPLKAEVRHKGSLDFIENGLHFKRIKLGIKFSKSLNLISFNELLENT